MDTDTMHLAGGGLALAIGSGHLDITTMLGIALGTLLLGIIKPLITAMGPHRPHKADDT